MTAATHDTTLRFGLGPKRLAHVFESLTFAEEAGVNFCQRFTSSLPVAIPSSHAGGWITQIAMDEWLLPAYLRSIE